MSNMVECSCTFASILLSVWSYCLSVLVRIVWGATQLYVLCMAIQAFAASSLCFLTPTKESFFSMLLYKDTCLQEEFFMQVSHPTPSFLSWTPATFSHVVCSPTPSVFCSKAYWAGWDPVLWLESRTVLPQWGRQVCSYRSTANHLVSSRQIFNRSDDRPRKNVSVMGR